MDDAHDAEPEQSPYIRLPWALVAGGLAAVLLVALGLGLYANRYLRPQVALLATPIAVPAAAVTAAQATPVPAQTLAPTPALVSIPAPAPAND